MCLIVRDIPTHFALVMVAKRFLFVPTPIQPLFSVVHYVRDVAIAVPHAVAVTLHQACLSQQPAPFPHSFRTN